MKTKNIENPLSELISDETYSLLESRGLINKKSCPRLFNSKKV